MSNCQFVIFLWAFTLIHHKSTSWRGILTGLLRSPLCATSTRPVLVSTNSSMYSVSLARLLEIEVAWCLYESYPNCNLPFLHNFDNFFNMMKAPGKWFLTAYGPNHCNRQDASRSVNNFSPTIILQWRKLVVAINNTPLRCALRKLGLPCLGTTAITTKIAPGRSGLSPGVQKPDEPQRSGSNRTLCGDTFNWCAP